MKYLLKYGRRENLTTERKQDDELEPIYNSSVPIQGIALKTSREQWTIKTGDERGSGRSVQAVQHEMMMMMYKQNTIVKWTKGCILLFPKKGDLGIIKNY